MSSKAEIMLANEDRNICLGDDKEGELLLIAFSFSEENTKVLLFPYDEKYENLKHTYEMACIMYESFRTVKSKHESLLKSYNFCQKMCDSLCETKFVCNH